jgi:long-chain acyl-CoA synthetase
MERVWRKHYPERIQAEVDIPDIPLTDVLEQSVDRFPQNPALSFFGHEITYEQLNDQVHAFASSLQKAGVEKGDRVAIMLPNCPQLLRYHESRWSRHSSESNACRP